MVILATLQRIALIENYSVPGLNSTCTPCGVEPKSKVPISDGKPTEVATRVINTPINIKTIESEPTMRWIGPETIVDVILEGHEVVALADSGSQVNTIMPEFVNA